MPSTEQDAAAGHHRADGRWSDVLVEVKPGVHGFRNLHAALLQLAVYVGEHPAVRGLLVLVEPRIAEARLREEVASVTRVLREDVRDRVSLAVARDGRIDGIPDRLGDEFRAWLDELVRRETGRTGLRLKRADAFSVVLQLLVNRWLEGAGPVTTAWLMSATGFSYPTVARALGRLSGVVQRGSDRSVELSRFPRDEWARFVAGAAEFRSTVCFVDASGQARSADALFDRVRRLRRQDIAVGGIIGARHHHPGLDLVGSPRLDLSVHRPDDRLDVAFVQQLDPALQPQAHAQPGESRRPAALAVHCVRRSESLFTRDSDGVAWADPVECLLDLYEARLDQQAEDFVQHFAAERQRRLGELRP
ncbi:MAG: hypothetical protein K8T90_19075 [Planctomycetes bacterium]|nr:hypothetical protein [Planctomycetota bacterium]